ncbi:MAG TPA: hypothetical protein PKA41_17280 [Verrucomicrobiota bacterium]|nr:hypothetical protein [Verrucomicrobiota bacterium]
MLVKLGEIEGVAEAVNREIASLPGRMAEELPASEVVQAARYLYWHTEMPPQAIAEGLLKMEWRVDSFLDRIGPITIEVECDRCHHLMECRSRSKRDEVLRDASRNCAKYAEGYRVLCSRCWSEVQQERLLMRQY